MKETDLISALLKQQVDGCVDCDCEANCAINGCSLHGLAADRIAEYDSALENIKAVHKRASGAERKLLQDIIALLILLILAMLTHIRDSGCNFKEYMLYTGEISHASRRQST